MGEKENRTQYLFSILDRALWLHRIHLLRREHSNADNGFVNNCPIK